jgi:glycosyltransferase involved in cell wall biosynthesis
MINLTEGFLLRGEKVDLLLAQKEGAFLKTIPKGASLVDLNASRVRYAIGGLVSYLRQNRPIGLLSSMDHSNVVALIARDLARVQTRVVVSLHTTLSATMIGVPFWRRKLMPHFLRLSYRRADAVVAVSEGVANDASNVTGFPRERFQVIYNPVVTPELIVKAAESVEHPWFNIGEPPVLLAVGRLTEPKDYGLLIQAVKMVRQTRPVRLIVLGEGEERPALESLVADLDLQDFVALPGFVSNPYAYMRHARLFVLSSRREGLPTVLIEAMAVGVPVVATDCPSGPFEILKGGKLGALVPVGDSSSLAEAILQALESKSCYSRDLDLGRFERDQAVQSYLKLLKGL